VKAPFVIYIAFKYKDTNMANNVTFPAWYGGGSLAFATEPAGSGSNTQYSYQWKVTIANTSSDVISNGTLYHKVYRNSGSVAGGELGNTFNTNTLISTGTSGEYYFRCIVYINNDATDETNWQGESFTLKIFKDSTLADEVGSHNFILYDADFDVSLDSPSSQTIAPNITSVTINFTNNGTTASGQTCRLAKNSGGTTATTSFADSLSYVIPNSHLPSSGSTETYNLEVYNGQSYYSVASSFSINRSSTTSATILVENGAIFWIGAGGTSAASPFDISGSTVVTFINSGISQSAVTLSGFGSQWTNTSSISLSAGASTTKTWGASNAGGSLDLISVSATGYTTLNRWFRQPFIDPDISITEINSIDIPNSATSFSLTIAAGSSPTVYEVKENSSTGTVVGSRTGNGIITVTSLPSDNSAKGYFLTGKVTTANGGNNTPTLIQTFSVFKGEATGSEVGDGGSGTYGLLIKNDSGDTVLDISDRSVIFIETVTDSLSSAQLTKSHTLSRAATSAVDLAPLTVPVVGNVAQRQKILRPTFSGNTFTVTRASTSAIGGSAESVSYSYLLIYDPTV